MKREDLDREVSALLNEKSDYEAKIKELDGKVSALRAKYVAEYPHLIKAGSKVRIKFSWGRDSTKTKEIIAFIEENHFVDGYDYYLSAIYPDNTVAATLLQVKKDGTPSTRREQIYGKVVEIEILE